MDDREHASHSIDVNVMTADVRSLSRKYIGLLMISVLVARFRLIIEPPLLAIKLVGFLT
jgi:hypothetical protein